MKLAFADVTCRFIKRLIAFLFFAVLSPVSLAQNNLPNSSSADAILRHLRLERERVSPIPTPNLNISAPPGKQAVVLRPYDRQAPPSEQPVLLHIPSVFFSKPVDAAVEVYGINLLIQYPSMNRYFEKYGGCSGWCEGKILLSLENQNATVTLAVKRRRQEMEQLSSTPEPLISYVRVAPPSDYDEAYEVIYNKWKDGARYKSLYWAYDGVCRVSSSCSIAELPFCLFVSRRA